MNKNLALGYVLTPPSPALSGTTFVLGPGEGARFADPASVGSYDVTLGPPNVDLHAGNSEIGLLTAKSGNTLTITRAQNSTNAQSVVAGWRVFEGLYIADVPVKATGTEINTGTNDTKFATPKAIMDSNVAFLSDMPVKNAGTDINTGTNDVKFSTAKAIQDSYLSQQYNSLFRQSLINSNFDIWQRGTTDTAPAGASLLADRWKRSWGADGGTPPSLVHSRQVQTGGDVFGSNYFYRIAPNGAGSGFGANSYYGLVQLIENGTSKLCGLNKTVTISFWARSSIANKKLGIFLSQGYGSGGSPSGEETIAGTTFTLTSSWALYTATITTNTLVGKTFGTNNDDYLILWFLYQIGSGLSAARNGTTIADWTGSGNIDIAQVQLCAGIVALPYQPRSFAQELAECQRYYEKSYDYDVFPGTNSSLGMLTHNSTGANYENVATVIFKTTKRVSPTMHAYTNAGTIDKIRLNGASDLAAIWTSVGKNAATLTVNNAANTVKDEMEVQWVADAEM